MTEPYNCGGVVYSDKPTRVRIEVGERVITADETVYELQACEGGCKWVEVGKGYVVWMGGPA